MPISHCRRNVVRRSRTLKPVTCCNVNEDPIPQASIEIALNIERDPTKKGNDEISVAEVWLAAATP